MNLGTLTQIMHFMRAKIEEPLHLSLQIFCKFLSANQSVDCIDKNITHHRAYQSCLSNQREHIDTSHYLTEHIN